MLYEEETEDLNTLNEDLNTLNEAESDYMSSKRPVLYQLNRPDSWDPGNGDGRCTTCKAWWNGKSRCHCSGDHLTFSSISAFDKHQSAEGCHDPAERGLHLYPTGLWGFPPFSKEELLTLFS